MPEPEDPSRSCYGATPLTSAIERAVAAVGPERLNRGLFTSQSCEWATPQWLYNLLNAEFGPFDLDVCANAQNAKAERYYGDEVWSGLALPWRGRVWMNPPYGRAIGQWVRKAWEAGEAGALVVCLLPSRTDTAWWHDYVMEASQLRFIRGRLHFNDAGPAPFPSAIVIFGDRA